MWSKVISLLSNDILFSSDLDIEMEDSVKDAIDMQ